MEISTEIITEYQVVCNICGKPLDAELVGEEIIVDPCKHCLEDEYQKGKDEA